MFNKLERWFLRKLAKKALSRGNQYNGSQVYFSFLIEEARKSFTEDNDTTLRHFLTETFDRECNKHFKFAQKDIHEDK